MKVDMRRVTKSKPKKVFRDKFGDCYEVVVMCNGKQAADVVLTHIHTNPIVCVITTPPATGVGCETGAIEYMYAVLLRISEAVEELGELAKTL
jgi:hypothetical protein